MDGPPVIWIALAVAVIIALPFVIEATRKPMTAKARMRAPGAFAQLSQGATHYRWYGPEDGPIAVCVHGLTTPSFVWGGLAKGLTDMGFRVLVYDLYGRGFSDRPGGPQDHAFFQSQLNDLLTDQGVQDDITLIGYSMGGAIATRFAAQQPQRIRRLILLAPAGTAPVVTGLLAFAAHTPSIGRWLMLLRYPTVLRNGLKREQSQPSSVVGINAMQEAELDWRGFVPAVWESLCGVLAKDMRTEHEQVQKGSIPVLAIWGEEDSVIPLRSSQVLRTWNNHVQTAVVPGAGHGLPYSHTTDVLKHIDSFLNDRP
ncbi:alpha/beta hydrolase [uncultured Roseobacter sp.]|uniref:alpha/beta fold hydrolase n=1 Tax=uncultured Roseobacter sp. TaxID=114847 RepID=UPI0026057DF9|nr:alpha/beta hydrolase [uncultured Roseobacter sp.]